MNDYARGVMLRNVNHTARGIVPVATAVVCTTMISWGLRGFGSILDIRKPIKADCNDILQRRYHLLED